MNINENEILLVVNGKRHPVQAAEDTPLLYILRNELGFTGPPFGCGEETCSSYYSANIMKG
jgi:nicotinate dehydrogenase subunit A